MTTAEKMAQRLEATTVDCDGVRLARIPTPTDLDAAALIRRQSEELDKLARALVASGGKRFADADELVKFYEDHADALKIAEGR